jgi:membrane AbrB-like protein
MNLPDSFPKIACLICSALAGAAAYALAIPLAWVLAPLVVTALFAMSGYTPWAPQTGRRFGQILIGCSIGTRLTPEVLAGMVGWVPAMVITALAAMMIGAGLSRGLAYFGKIDLQTAYFAMMPGGLSEMSNIGARSGARSEPIALAQALRVALVVCVLPAAIVSLGIDGHFQQGQMLVVMSHLALVPLIVAGLAGVALMRAVRMNNPWMIGALLGVAVLSAGGYATGRMPRDVLYVGQFLIGIAIGARFRRDVVSHLVRLTLVCSVFILLMTALLFGLALVLAWGSGIDIASAALSASPGGFAEMAATAETLHLNVALVAGFHIVRAFLVNGLVTSLWKFLHLIGFFKIGGTRDPDHDAG